MKQSIVCKNLQKNRQESIPWSVLPELGFAFLADWYKKTIVQSVIYMSKPSNSMLSPLSPLSRARR